MFYDCDELYFEGIQRSLSGFNGLVGSVGIGLSNCSKVYIDKVQISNVSHGVTLSNCSDISITNSYLHDIWSSINATTKKRFHSQGIHAVKTVGLRLERLILQRIGYVALDPNSPRSVFNQGIYITSDCDGAILNDILVDSASNVGVQPRCGGKLRSILTTNCACGIQVGSDDKMLDANGIQYRPRLGGVKLELEDFILHKLSNLSPTQLQSWGLWLGNILEAEIRYGLVSGSEFYKSPAASGLAIGIDGRAVNGYTALGDLTIEDLYIDALTGRFQIRVDLPEKLQSTNVSYYTVGESFRDFNLPTPTVDTSSFENFSHTELPIETSLIRVNIVKEIIDTLTYNFLNNLHDSLTLGACIDLVLGDCERAKN